MNRDNLRGELVPSKMRYYYGQVTDSERFVNFLSERVTLGVSKITTGGLPETEKIANILRSFGEILEEYANLYHLCHGLIDIIYSQNKQEDFFSKGVNEGSFCFFRASRG
jgi:hypothetical protein